MRLFSSPESLSLALAIALTLSACGAQDRAADSVDAASSIKRHEATRVRVLPVIQQEMQRALETTTVVEAERHVIIQPLTSGIVIEVLAEEGDQVQANDVLARLDQRDALAQLADAKIALQEAKDAAAKSEITKRDAENSIEKFRLAFEQAKRDFERNEKARMISALDIEKLKLAMDTAEQDMKTATLARDRAVIDERTMGTAIARAQLTVDRAAVTLSNSEMRAPFSGVITKRDVQVGDNVGPSVQAFTITDLSDLRTVFYRPQRELALFTSAARHQPDDAAAAASFDSIEVTATSEALPGHEFKGRIERISPNIDSTSGSFRVTVRLDPESGDARLLPGMFLRLRLVTERHMEAITVSKRALRREGETTILFVAEAGRARRVEVQEGFSGDEYVEVHSVKAPSLQGGELRPGLQVIVVGNRDLEEDKEIEITPWDDELEPENPAKVAEDGAAAPEPSVDASKSDASTAESSVGGQ